MLVVVSKGRSNAEVLEVYEAGQRDFGENRAGALQDRLASGLPTDIRWHFVGSLQRRKVRDVVGAVTLLHSMDRPELARAWVEHGGGPALMEVNVSAEPQKHGFDPDGVVEAAGGLVAAGVDLRGLMAIPAAPSRPEDSRPAFEAMRSLRDEVAALLPEAGELSMGMTDDFEVAVECGATIVRVGRAIFDEPPDPGASGWRRPSERADQTGQNGRNG
jgi:pyridoxal phosphate enzyme (YggS family)